VEAAQQAENLKRDVMETTRRMDDALPKVSLWIWCLLGLVFWQVFLWAQNPSLMSDDSGEMIAAAYRLGIAHPPAYPLFCLMGRLFSFIPVGTVAFRFNLLSSLFVLFSFYFLGMSCVAFQGTARKKGSLAWLFGAASCFLSLFFLFSCRSVFAQALTAKGCVYTLTLLFLALFLWLRVKHFEKGMGFSTVFIVLFLWSLGLSNHWESEVLWVPFLIYWFHQEKFKWNLKLFVQSVSLILMGLSLYLYLPLRSALGVLPCWGAPQSLQGFIWVITREAYRGMEPLFRKGSFYVSFLKEYFRILSVYWLPGFVILASIGLFYLWRQYRALFYSTLILYIPVVLAVLAVPREETKFLMTVYLVPTQGLLAFWGFIGISLLLQKLSGLKTKLAMGAVVFLFGAGLFWTCRVFKQEDKSRYYLAADFSINALKLLPSKSFFLAEGDNYVVPLFYQRFVLGLRPDVVFIPSIFLTHLWGWNQLAAQDERVAAARSAMLYDWIEALSMMKGRGGLFYTIDQAYLRTGAMNESWTPWALERLDSKTAINPQWVSDHVLKLADTERFRGLNADYDPSDITTFEIHHYYANQYFLTALWLHTKGDWDDALRCFERGLPFYPKAAYAYNYMAAILGSQGYLGLAEKLCLLGIEADPGYYGCYENLANVYRLQGDSAKAKDCWQLGLSRATDLGRIQGLEEMYGKKVQTITGDKSAGDYRLLADRFQKEGLVFLEKLARQVGQAGR